MLYLAPSRDNVCAKPSRPKRLAVAATDGSSVILIKITRPLCCFRKTGQTAFMQWKAPSKASDRMADHARLWSILALSLSSFVGVMNRTLSILPYSDTACWIALAESGYAIMLCPVISIVLAICLTRDLLCRLRRFGLHDGLRKHFL